MLPSYRFDGASRTSGGSLVASMFVAGLTSACVGGTHASEAPRDERRAVLSYTSHASPTTLSAKRVFVEPRNAAQEMDFINAVTRFYETLLVGQKPLDADAARIFDEHSWDLYVD